MTRTQKFAHRNMCIMKSSGVQLLTLPAYEWVVWILNSSGVQLLTTEVWQVHPYLLTTMTSRPNNREPAEQLVQFTIIIYSVISISLTLTIQLSCCCLQPAADRVVATYCSQVCVIDVKIVFFVITYNHL